MRHLNSYKLKTCLAISLTVAAFLSLLSSCGEKKENQVVVDFAVRRKTQSPRNISDTGPKLRFAIAAMLSPEQTFVSYRRFLDYLGGRMGEKVELVQRKTYGEINRMFAKGQVDAGFICSGPYALGRKRYGFELLVTPEVKGSHFYRAYLIVNHRLNATTLQDLRGKTFAFTDPDSNTGSLVPRFWLAEIGERPKQFFKTVIYTYSHDNSISAVSKGLVDGASVDSLIWNYYEEQDPSVTSNTRIILKSKPLGIPPIVASRDLSDLQKRKITTILLHMNMDPVGKSILKQLMIDRFVVPNDSWYKPIRKMRDMIALRGDGP